MVAAVRQAAPSPRPRQVGGLIGNCTAQVNAPARCKGSLGGRRGGRTNAVRRRHFLLFPTGSRCYAAGSCISAAGRRWRSELAELFTPDVCVIGAGAGGLAVAEAALGHGASVLVVERDRVGGGRLHGGSIASKALIAAAYRAHVMRGSAAFGITGEARIQFRKTHDHIQSVIAATAPRDSAARLEALGAQVVSADARFADPRTLIAGEATVRARRFVIATGSRPVVPVLPGLNTVPFFTSETIFDNTRKLTHLLIVGGGRVGLELAQAYSRLGSQVTLLDQGTPLADADPELATILLARLRDEGVDIRPASVVSHIQARSQGIGVTVMGGTREDRLDVSHILVATGRRPNLETLELAKARIGLEKSGARLKLSPGLRTTNPRVYAVGDSTGGAQSDQLAQYQAGLVVRNALFGLPGRADTSLVPRALHTDPGLAEVGLTEPMLHERRKTGYRILRAGFAENDRARTERDTHGLAKLVTDPSGRILGAGVVGPGAGELVALFGLAIAGGISARQLAGFVAPYPTHAAIAGRLGAEFGGGERPSIWLQRLMALNRLLP